MCDDSWDMDDARVACRELGYPDAASALQSAHFGAGSGQIWLDDVNCAGSEDSIENCPHYGWGSHNCGHHEDASVVCLSKYASSACSVSRSEKHPDLTKINAHNNRFNSTLDHVLF